IRSRARWPATGAAMSRRRWRPCRPRRARSSFCARSRIARTNTLRRCSICRSAPSCRAWRGRARSWRPNCAAAWEGVSMDCPTCEAMVDAYLDGELSAADSAEFERALEACPDCRKRLEAGRAMSGLLRELPLEPAPDLLRARVERELRAIAGRPLAKTRERVRWSAMAASLIVVLGIGWVGGTLTGRGSGDDELVSTYLRVASSDHPVDVASTDRHTVKPWFAGRIDYSPPVHDLTAAGFPLE